MNIDTYFFKGILLSGMLLMPMAYAQECKPSSIPATTPTSQFTDHGDGTVTDNKTGLMWKKCSEGQIWNAGMCGGNLANHASWKGTLERSQAINTSGGFAGYSDWRVPNITELESIVEEQCYDPAINLMVFPNTPSFLFWSSSPTADSGSSAWNVDFDGGRAEISYSKYFDPHVRLVRGGQ